MRSSPRVDGSSLRFTVLFSTEGRYSQVLLSLSAFEKRIAEAEARRKLARKLALRRGRPPTPSRRTAR